MSKSFLRHLPLLFACWAIGAVAQVGPDDPVLVENATAKVYRSDYEAELLKLPADIRPGFANNQKRIGDLLARLLVQKTLAVQPETVALAKEPHNAVRVRLETDRALAQIRVEDIERRAAQSFDAHRADYEARAKEIYLADRKKFEKPEQVSVSHILFDLRKHSRDEGLKLAQQARARIVAGEDFNKVAIELSEDPTARQNEGHIGFFERTQMDPAFSKAAFALKQEGEVSEPVLSSFGWHLIKREEYRAARLRPFEEARPLIMADLRKRYIEEQREAAIAAVRDDPTTKVNKELVDSLYVRPPTPAELPDAQSNVAPGGRKGARAASSAR
jgi:parvulin-like peptidyl-prolyl isomerase